MDGQTDRQTDLDLTPFCVQQRKLCTGRPD
uniref:Uncharacterized protein n=1 Tax=Anguilla anguilla TaxID=7936 RepID=A0A0E9W4K0_ANGAN